jgi:hypothetical protein
LLKEGVCKDKDCFHLAAKKGHTVAQLVEALRFKPDGVIGIFN